MLYGEIYGVGKNSNRREDMQGSRDKQVFSLSPRKCLLCIGGSFS